MAITLRGNKGSALTYGELDANYTTLGLTHGMTTSNVAISVDTVTATTANLTTINATSTTIDDDIDIGDILMQNKSILPAKGVHVLADDQEDRWALFQLEEYINNKPYSINNPSVMGLVHRGSVASPIAVEAYKTCLAITGAARNGTGADDTDAVGQLRIETNEAQSSTNKGGAIKMRIIPNGTTSMRDAWKINGTDTRLDNSFDPDGDFDKTTWSTQSTDGFEFDSVTKMNQKTTFADTLNLEPTNYADLPASPSTGDIAMLVNDGAGTYQGKPIYYSNQWQYFDTNGPVATS
jgi:hypothetical protein